MTEDREYCRLSKATLRRSVQELDSKIVAACNDLLRLRSYTPRMVVDNSNERARLKRVCEQREALLKKRLQEAISSKLLCTYQEVCEQSLAEQGRSIPVAVTSRQVQLLHHIHTMTIFDNQRDLLDKHKSQEYVDLENEVNKIQQEQSMNENRILRDNRVGGPDYEFGKAAKRLPTSHNKVSSTIASKNQRVRFVKSDAGNYFIRFPLSWR